MRPNSIIDKLLLSNDLQKKEAVYILSSLLNGKLDNNSAKSVLALLHRKGESATELLALIRLARTKGIVKNCAKNRLERLCDACGTGGDGKRTFNISTISSIVAAAAGAKIAKHGNRSITSRCGSSDLMESLGVKLETHPKTILRSIQKAGIGYFHAPYFNRAFANVQGIRKELATQKIKTLFNMAGPLLNPLKVKRQLIGVYHPSLIPIILWTLKQLGSTHVIAISGKNGTDEFLTNQITYAGELKNNKIRYFSIKPSFYQLKSASNKSILGNTPERNRQIALDLLSGKDVGPRRDIVLANAGLILYVSKNARDLHDGILKAREALTSGRALVVLDQARRISNAT